MKLSPHFTVQEMVSSPTAARLGIVNAPGMDELAGLRRLCLELEKIRARWYAPRGVGMRINSAYRCPELNAAVGGSPNSYHMVGLAADFDPPPGMTHDALQQAIKNSPDIEYDVLAEEGTAKPESEGGSRWLHFQIAKLGEKSRRHTRDWEVDRLGGKIVRSEKG